MISRGRTDTRNTIRLAAATLLAAAALWVLLSVQVAQAGSPPSSGSPKATASAVSDKQFKKLKRTVARQQQQISQLQQQVSALTTQPGPQGPQGQQGIQGPAGTAPACAGNGSGDTMVAAGAVCIDRYEVSVWSSPTGGTQYGVGSDNYPD